MPVFVRQDLDHSYSGYHREKGLHRYIKCILCGIIGNCISIINSYDILLIDKFILNICCRKSQSFYDKNKLFILFIGFESQGIVLMFLIAYLFHIEQWSRTVTRRMPRIPDQISKLHLLQQVATGAL